MSPPEIQQFRVRLSALWRQVFPVATAAAAVSTLGRWAAGHAFSWPSTLPFAIVAGFIVLGMHWLRPVQAQPDGILLLRRLGNRKLVAWRDIAAVSFGRRLPLEPAFRVVDSHGKSYWLPRHTARLRELQMLAVRFGGASHPLARALETPICDAP